MSVSTSIQPSPGQVWADSDGQPVNVIGLRASAVAVRDGDGKVGWVERHRFIGTHIYQGCDHSDHCCDIHSVHVSPHRGCVLR